MDLRFGTARTACLLLLVLPIVVPVGTAHAARTYHVAPDGARPSAAPKPGDCPGGTEADPWGQPYVRSDGERIHQIEYAMRCLTAGDALVINGGTYTDRAFPFLADENRGTASQPVTVMARPGERVVLRGLLRLDQADHWHITGLNITSDGGAYGGGEYLLKMLGGTGWSVRDSEIWGARGPYAAVRIEQSSPQTGPNVSPTNWAFVGNCVHDTAPANGDGQDHNLYIHTGPGGSGTVERNLVFGAPNGQNIKLGSGTGEGDQRTDNVEVRHNTLYGAHQNVMIVGDSRNNLIARNLMGRGAPAPGKDWYPNVRGFNLKGQGNAARDNAGFQASQLVLVGKDGGSSTASISESGNLFPVTPQLDATSGCTNFYPTKGSYRAFGAYAPVAADDPIRRIAGSGRVETSVEISKATFPKAANASTIVLARSDTYPDALAGGPLAAALDAPILLTGRDRLDGAVAHEVERLGASEAVLLGGEAALSDRVRREVESMGLSVRRLQGKSRFGTAAAVADELATISGTDPQHVYVVEGADADPSRGWPDAVAVGSLAAQQGRAILLVTTESLPDETRAALSDLSVDRVSVIGGVASVSDSVAKAIARSGPTVDRIAGSSRFETSWKIATVARKAGADASRVWFATGGSFPDALAAGPAVAADGGVLLLVPGGSTFLNAEAAGWLERHETSIGTLNLIGGTAAISPAIEDKSRYRLSPW